MQICSTLAIHRFVRIGMMVATQHNQIRRNIRAPLPEIDRVQMVHFESVQCVIAADLAPGAVQFKRLCTQRCADLFVAHHDLATTLIDASHLESGWHCCGKIMSPISVIKQK
jgi:hypothetical protein